MEEKYLKDFVCLCLGQIMLKNSPPTIAFNGETTGWRCNISNETSPDLSAAYVQCSDCIVTCSTSIVRWFWQRKMNTRPCYADLYLEISFTHLAQMVMAYGQREYTVKVTDPSHSASNCDDGEQFLLERIFRGKTIYENVDPDDRGDTICFLCQDDISATGSRMFYSCLCDTTIKSKGGIHASCLLSGLLKLDTLPASLRLKKTIEVGADMKCNNCKESLTGYLVCMLPYRVGKDLHFDILRQPMLNYIDPTEEGGTKSERKVFLWERYHTTRKMLHRTLKFCPHERDHLFQDDGIILPHPQPLASVDDPGPSDDDDSQSSEVTFPFGDPEDTHSDNNGYEDNDNDNDNDEESVVSSDSSIIAVDAVFPLITSNHNEIAVSTLSTMETGASPREKRGLKIAFSSCVQTTRTNSQVVLPILPTSFSRLRQLPQVVGDDSAVEARCYGTSIPTEELFYGPPFQF
jgi:hypothetical protein